MVVVFAVHVPSILRLECVCACGFLPSLLLLSLSLLLLLLLSLSLSVSLFLSLSLFYFLSLFLAVRSQKTHTMLQGRDTLKDEESLSVDEGEEYSDSFEDVV